MTKIPCIFPTIPMLEEFEKNIESLTPVELLLLEKYFKFFQNKKEPHRAFSKLIWGEINELIDISSMDYEESIKNINHKQNCYDYLLANMNKEQLKGLEYFPQITNIEAMSNDETNKLKEKTGKNLLDNKEIQSLLSEMTEKEFKAILITFFLRLSNLSEEEKLKNGYESHNNTSNIIAQTIPILNKIVNYIEQLSSVELSLLDKHLKLITIARNQQYFRKFLNLTRNETENLNEISSMKYEKFIWEIESKSTCYEYILACMTKECLDELEYFPHIARITAMSNDEANRLKEDMKNNNLNNQEMHQRLNEMTEKEFKANLIAIFLRLSHFSTFNKLKQIYEPLSDTASTIAHTIPDVQYLYQVFNNGISITAAGEYITSLAKIVEETAILIKEETKSDETQDNQNRKKQIQTNIENLKYVLELKLGHNIDISQDFILEAEKELKAKPIFPLNLFDKEVGIMSELGADLFEHAISSEYAEKITKALEVEKTFIKEEDMGFVNLGVIKYARELLTNIYNIALYRSKNYYQDVKDLINIIKEKSNTSLLDCISPEELAESYEIMNLLSVSNEKTQSLEKDESASTLVLGIKKINN